MDERIYNDNKEYNLVKKGFYKGNMFAIVSSRGNYPTAYVEVPKKYTWDEFEQFNIDVHWGVNFCGKLGVKELKDIMLLGWDYAHVNDYNNSDYSRGLGSCLDGGTMHTVEEIQQECEMAINQLISIGVLTEKEVLQ